MTSERETITAAAMFAVTCCCYFVLAASTAGRTRHRRQFTRRRGSANSITNDETKMMSKEEILQLRHKHFSTSLSVSYANSNPLLIVKVSEKAQFGLNRKINNKKLVLLTTDVQYDISTDPSLLTC